MRIWTSVALGLVLVALSSEAVSFAQSSESEGDPLPNVLVLMADDLTYTDLPLYGGTNIETPNINRLAEEGLTFTRAFVEMSMCTPSRSALYTGKYPSRNGSVWNHAPVRSGTESIVHRLENYGYRVGLAGKKHVFPDEAFPFEDVPGVDGRAVSEENPFDPEGIREFMSRDGEEPFALVVASTLPHVVWTAGNPEALDEEELELPPYFVDTPQTREDLAKYLAEISVLDRRIGRVLEVLEETGEEDDTLVLFTSEQGAQWPGAKWTNWAAGVQTGVIARWPGQIEGGRRTDALVQYVDVLPTLIDAAGGEPEAHAFDGESFLPVLRGETDEHRDYAYFMHNNVPEGPPYPIRGLTDGEYYYIRNLTPDRLYIEKHLMGRPSHNPYWVTWKFATAEDDHAEQMVNRYMTRPAEELYHQGRDRHQMNNLAGDSAHEDAQERLSNELERWMNRQGDPGAELDTWGQFEAAGEGNHWPLSSSGRE